MKLTPALLSVFPFGLPSSTVQFVQQVGGPWSPFWENFCLFSERWGGCLFPCLFPLPHKVLTPAGSWLTFSTAWIKFAHSTSFKNAEFLISYMHYYYMENWFCSQPKHFSLCGNRAPHQCGKSGLAEAMWAQLENSHYHEDRLNGGKNDLKNEIYFGCIRKLLRNRAVTWTNKLILASNCFQQNLLWNQLSSRVCRWRWEMAYSYMGRNSAFPLLSSLQTLLKEEFWMEWYWSEEGSCYLWP